MEKIRKYGGNCVLFYDKSDEMEPICRKFLLCLACIFHFFLSFNSLSPNLNTDYLFIFPNFVYL